MLCTGNKMERCFNWADNGKVIKYKMLWVGITPVLVVSGESAKQSASNASSAQVPE